VPVRPDRARLAAEHRRLAATLRGISAARADHRRRWHVHSAGSPTTR